MKEEVLRFLDAVHKMPPALRKHLFSLLTERHIPKKAEILKKGEICNEIFFVISGMVVAQKWQKGQWVTTWIMKEGDVVTSPQSFFDRTPSMERLIAVEPCVILGITWEELEDTYRQFEEFNRHGRIITQRYYTQNLDLTDFMKRYTAKEKYRMLLEKDSNMIMRCPDKYLASYLNVNTTTFSTIKSSVMKEGKFRIQK
jgi:CRP/FNR family transcriptional regulator, anaerobic regulatory protein